MSPQGDRLKRIVAAGTTGHRIVKAIEWLKTNFAKPFSIEELASTMGMSASSFHQHFRDITSMSPLQYQKNEVDRGTAFINDRRIRYFIYQHASRL